MGERLINNNVTNLPGRGKLFVEQEVTIISMGPVEELELYDKTQSKCISTIQTSIGDPVLPEFLFLRIHCT